MVNSRVAQCVYQFKVSVLLLSDGDNGLAELRVIAVLKTFIYKKKHIVFYAVIAPCRAELRSLFWIRK